MTKLSFDNLPEICKYCKRLKFLKYESLYCCVTPIPFQKSRWPSSDSIVCCCFTEQPIVQLEGEHYSRGKKYGMRRK